MGFSDWMTGTKCAECGKKIQGPRFARTVMGASVWVCGACNEKEKEARRLDTQRSIAEGAERRQQNAVAEQERAKEAAAAIQQRSDVDIAEAMSVISLREYATFYKELQAVAGNAGFNHQDAFLYFLAISSYAFRRFLGLQMDNTRLDRIEETAARYALAGFIHGMIRNTAEVERTEPIREKLLATLVEGYRKVSSVHQGNVDHLLNMPPEKHEEAAFAYFLPRTLDWFGKDFVEASVERKTRLMQAAGKAFFQAMGVGNFLQPQLAAVKSFVNREIDFPLPDSWLLRHEKPFRYHDPSTPQYALLVSIGSPLSTADAPEVVLRKLLAVLSRQEIPQALGPKRAIVHYQSNTPENGQPKDDHHWMLAESTEGNITRYAFFTLSVLAARADASTTEALVVSLQDGIQQARFLG